MDGQVVRYRPGPKLILEIPALTMSKRAIVVPLIVLLVAGLLFFVINGRWTSWFGGRAEQETEDAYVQADMTPLSTRISGTVRQMKVEDFDSV